MRSARDLISQTIAWPAAGIFSPLHRAAWQAMRRKRDLHLHASPEEIRREQCRRLRRLVRAHRKDPLQGEALRSVRLPDPDCLDPREWLAGFPLLSREDLQRRQDRPPAAGARGCYRNQSGGSSGEPVSLWQDWTFAVESLATTFLADRVHGWIPGGRYAWLWGNRRESGIGTWKRDINRWLKNEVILDAFDLNPARLREYVDFLDQWQPAVLLGYASALEALARYLKDQGRTVAWPRRGVISSAEMLRRETRSLLEQVFPVKIYNRYGSREVGTLAFECAHGGLHLSPLDHIVEIVPIDDRDSQGGYPLERGSGMASHVGGRNERFSDDDTRRVQSPGGASRHQTGGFFPPGPTRQGSQTPAPPLPQGEVIVTVLTNLATPLIRYRLGDLGRLATGDCACGSRVPRLAELSGRTSDLFRLPDGRVVHGERFTHVVWGVAGIQAFQFVQETPSVFNLRVVADTSRFTIPDAERIMQELREILGADAILKLQYLDEIPVSPSGKRRFTMALT